MAENLALGTGRRKTAVARVYIRQGKGQITVNGKEMSEYFDAQILPIIVRQPLDVTDSLDKYDILVNVRGGGKSGQAEACRHAISRALCKIDPANTSTLRANKFLTRDSRMVERKKYGRRGARRRFQFSKR